MSDSDGMIVALEKKAMEEMKEKIKEKFNDNHLLFPNIIE